MAKAKRIKKEEPVKNGLTEQQTDKKTVSRDELMKQPGFSNVKPGDPQTIPVKAKF
jgi:hypothetical protein